MPSLWRRIASAICSPTVMTGLRLVMGSWNTMAILSPRIAWIRASFIPMMSSPWKRMEPLRIRPVLLGRRRRMLRAVVVLPAPVSPTRPMVLPLPMRRSMPFTAATVSRSVL
jgi:hypothetical protein